MSIHTVPTVTPTASKVTQPRAGVSGAHRGFVVGLFTLAIFLVANTVLGPLGANTIKYPITGTLLNQTIGLEAVTVGLVVPITLIAAVLALRGHEAAPLLGFGPATYAAYMFVQYVLGPEYHNYTTQVLFHTVVFSLSAGLSVWAWALATKAPLPRLTTRRRRLYGAILLLLAGFIITRYLPVITSGELPPEFDQARTFFWTILLLDLGVIVPATLVAAIGLIQGVGLAHTALYALMGWYALVPSSVAAMSATMVINNDPSAAPGQAIILGAVAIAFLGLASGIFLPVLRSHPVDLPQTSRTTSS